MRRFLFAARIGSRITQQIVDRFLAIARNDRAGNSSRAGRAGSLVVEPLESRWLMSAAPVPVGDFLPLGDFSAGTPSWSVSDSRLLDFSWEQPVSVGAGEESLGDATPVGTSYFIYDDWGGQWCDADKTWANTEDDYMCWAAAASNILEWSDWGQVGGMTTTDNMFAYFQNHWTDNGGLMGFGWDWWFDGVNDSQGSDWAANGWSQVDVPGGGFYPDEDFSSYYDEVSYYYGGGSAAMSTISNYLHNGYGTTIGIYGDLGGGHAITVWGVSYVGSQFTGIYVTDSDDGVNALRYYEVTYRNSAWYLKNFYPGSYGEYYWSIDAVQGLKSNPHDGEPEPEPNPVNDISGAVFDDTNANGAQDAGELGLAGQTVFLDANQNGVLDQVVHAASTNASKAITDRTTITSTLTVSGAVGTITDVNVSLNISHTYTADLTAYLISPNGTRVLLFDGVGASGHNFTGATLDDQAAQVINAASAPFNGDFRPQGLLASLNGESANGTWTLEITDNWTYDQGTLNGWSLSAVTTEAWTTTAADGSYSFAELPDGDYRVRVVVPDGWNQTAPASGYYNVSLAGGQSETAVDFGLTAFTAIDLGVIDYAHLDALDLGAGQHWYTFQTARDGYLTVAADVSLTDDVLVTLYDADLNALASSAVLDGLQRVDHLVGAGQTVFVCVDVSGGATLSDLYAVNLVQRSGSTVTVHGTSGADEFVYAVASWHQLAINGIQYDMFNSTEVTNIAFDGHAGNDRTVLCGSTGDDTLTTHTTSATLTGAGYAVSIAGTEIIIVLGEGGNDRANLYDSSGNDTFTATSTYGSLSGSGFYNYAEGFDSVYAYATAGGTDRANLYDSAGDDVFYGRTTGSYVSGVGFFNYAGGFESVYAYATAGGTDRACLFDSAGNDTFLGKANFSYLSGTDFLNYAVGFESVYAYATAGGTDRASLYDSAGNDTFLGKTNFSYLSGTNFLNYAVGFDSVYAYATAGGTDRASLYDSAGNDTFVGKSTYSVLFGASFYNYVAGFDSVYAYATAGGTDRASLFDSAGDDTFVGKSTYSTLFGTNFLNYAAGFDTVYAYANAGGNDSANLYDSAGNDRLIARNNLAQILYGDGSSISLYDFNWVAARATAGGSDTKDVDPIDYVLQTQGVWTDV